MGAPVRLSLALWILIAPLASLGAPSIAEAKDQAERSAIECKVRKDGKLVAGAKVRLVQLFAGPPQRSPAFHEDAINRRTAAALTGKLAYTTAVAADNKGVVRFEGIDAGMYMLRAEARGATRQVVVAVPARSTTVLASLDLTRGTVRVDGTIQVPADFRGWVSILSNREQQQRLVSGEWLMPKPVRGSGAFSFDGLPRGVHAAVLIRDDGRFAAQDVCLPGRETVLRPKSLELVSVRGRVTDAATGNPIADAAVSLRSGPVLTNTDKDGRFAAALSIRGIEHLVVVADGFARTEASVRAVGGLGARQPLVEVALPAESVVRGVVRGEGKSLANVPVVAVRLGAVGEDVAGLPLRPFLRTARTSRTDAKGRYELRKLPPGRYLLGVHTLSWMSPAFTATSRTHASAVDIHGGDGNRVDLVCTPTGSVTGRALSPRGKGVRGIQVLATTRVGARTRIASVASSGAGGNFTVRGLVPGRTYRIQSFSSNRSDASVADVQLGAGEATSVSLELGDAAWLDVSVRLWPTKEPAPGVILTLERLGLLQSLAGSGPTRAWITDKKGRARVGPLPLGTTALNAAGPELGRSELTFAPFQRKGGTRAVTLDMGKGTSVAGRVVLPAGATLDNVSFRILQDGGNRGGPVRRSSDGRFRLVGAPKGRFRVQAMLSHQGKVLLGNAPARADDTDVQIRLRPYRPEKGSGVWLVRVTGPDGIPVPRAFVTQVTVRPDAPAGSRERVKKDSMLDVKSGVALLNHPSGLYAKPAVKSANVSVWFEAYWAFDPDTKAPLDMGAAVVGPFTANGGTVDIRLPTPRTLMGRVVDDAGKPVVGVGFEAAPNLWNKTEAHYGHGEAESDSEGRFTLVRLGAVPYRLFLKKVPSAFIATPFVDVTEDQRDVRVVLRRGAQNTITVLSAYGEPVPRASVAAHQRVAGHLDMGSRRDGESRQDFWARMRAYNAKRPAPIEVEADATGKAVLKGLIPGAAYDLTAKNPDDLSLTGSLDNWSPGKDVSIALRAPSVIRGGVHAPDGTPVPGATVWYRGKEQAWQRHERSEYSTTLEDHEFWIVLHGLGPAAKPPTFFLWATTDPSAQPPTRRSEPEWKRVVEAQASMEPVNLTVKPGPAVRIEIADWKSSWSPATVLLVDPENETDEGLEVTTEDGRVAFHGRTPGTRHVAYVISKDRTRAGTAEVRVAKEAARIQLRSAGKISGKAVLPPGTPSTAFAVAAWSASGVGVSGAVKRDGTFTVDGLLPGEWTIVIAGRFGRVEYYGEATAKTGTTPTIRVTESE